jgi:hypothetical protein
VPGLMPITARALVWVSNSRGGFCTPALSAFQFLPSAVAAELKSAKLPAIQLLVKAASAALGMVEALAATQASPVCRSDAWQQPCAQGGGRGYFALCGTYSCKATCVGTCTWVEPFCTPARSAQVPGFCHRCQNGSVRGVHTVQLPVDCCWLLGLCQPRLQHWCCSVRCNASAVLAALGRKMELQLLAWPFLPTLAAPAIEACEIATDVCTCTGTWVVPGTAGARASIVHSLVPPLWLAPRFCLALPCCSVHLCRVCFHSGGGLLTVTAALCAGFLLPLA